MMSTPFLGTIQLLPFTFAPRGWLPCNGALMPISENTALFQLLGTTYGGDGKTTFGLPKLPPPQPIGPFYFIAIQGVFPRPASP